MKFGMPTLIECKDIYDTADVACENGLDFIEMNLSFPQYQVDNLDVESLKILARDKGLFYTIHADEQMNPFDFNKSVSECYFEEMRKTIRFALALDIPVINMHLLKGVYVTLPDRVVLLTDVYRDEYLDTVKRFIEMCESEIGNAPLKIAIENVDSNAFTVSQLTALEYFMRSPVFAMTLDVGHEFCLGFKDSFVFEKYPDKLFHMHLHDARGRSCHLALGSGEVKLSDKMELLKGETCLIEVKTIEGLRESVKYLKENLK